MTSASWTSWLSSPYGYNIVDGMEGEVVEQRGSVFQGRCLKNGWKNPGNSRTDELDPQLVYRSRQELTE